MIQHAVPFLFVMRMPSDMLTLTKNALVVVVVVL
jgi:hypothetical protein